MVGHSGLRSALLSIAATAVASSVSFAVVKGDDVAVRPPDRAPLAVTGSLRVAKGEWLRPSGEHGVGDAALIVEDVRGATLDLRGASWRGLARGESRENARGIGLWIRRAHGLRVLGGEFSGYRDCVRVEDSSDVEFEGTSCEDSFAVRLGSNGFTKSELDELDRADATVVERCGGGFELRRVEHATLTGCSARRGTVGVAIVDCNRVTVVDGEFDHQSAFGIAAFGAKELVLARNLILCCARGSTGGSWIGGQGSAGISIDASPLARIGENLVQHCATAIAVQGASAHASIVRNDLSYSVVNALEIQSTDADICENVIRTTGADAIALAGAARTHVLQNDVTDAHGSALAIRGGSQIAVIENWFGRSVCALRALDVDDLVLEHDAFHVNDTDWELEHVRALATEELVFDLPGAEAHADVRIGAPSGTDLEALKDRLRGIGGLLPRGRMSNCEPTSLDPERRAAIESEIAGIDRSFPGRRAPRADAALHADCELALGELGPWDPNGREARPRARARGGLLADAKWNARWFRWTDDADPRGGSELERRWLDLAKAPTVSATVGAWTSPWGESARSAEIGVEHVGLVAQSRITLAPGRYRLSVTSDDGVRISVDGKRVLENWTWHGPTVDRSEFELDAGEHQFDLQYFQVDGGAALELELDRIGS